MTWDEFVTRVNAALSAKGYNGEVQIAWIDVAYNDGFDVHVSQDGRLEVA